MEKIFTIKISRLFFPLFGVRSFGDRWEPNCKVTCFRDLKFRSKPIVSNSWQQTLRQNTCYSNDLNSAPSKNENATRKGNRP